MEKRTASSTGREKHPIRSYFKETEGGDQNKLICIFCNSKSAHPTLVSNAARELRTHIRKCLFATEEAKRYANKNDSEFKSGKRKLEPVPVHFDIADADADRDDDLTTPLKPPLPSLFSPKRATSEKRSVLTSELVQHVKRLEKESRKFGVSLVHLGTEYCNVDDVLEELVALLNKGGQLVDEAKLFNSSISTEQFALDVVLKEIQDFSYKRTKLLLLLNDRSRPSMKLFEETFLRRMNLEIGNQSKIFAKIVKTLLPADSEIFQQGELQSIE